MTGDAAHLGVTGVLLGDPTGKDGPVDECYKAQYGDWEKIDEMFHRLILTHETLS
jgi:hypothetical protein